MCANGKIIKQLMKFTDDIHAKKVMHQRNAIAMTIKKDGDISEKKYIITAMSITAKSKIEGLPKGEIG